MRVSLWWGTRPRDTLADVVFHLACLKVQVDGAGVELDMRGFLVFSSSRVMQTARRVQFRPRRSWTTSASCCCDQTSFIKATTVVDVMKVVCDRNRIALAMPWERPSPSWL